ncbi:MAG TPA: hypothetical protein DCS93_31805 [Microscillaceae bacterium]|nr:hypothetical protein [Microscillaceae bacterium]
MTKHQNTQQIQSIQPRLMIAALLLSFSLIQLPAVANNIVAATIPIKMVGEHIFIKLQVGNSQQLNFIFDTGAGGTVINLRTAQSLKLRPSGFTPVKSAHSQDFTPYFANNQLKLAHLSVSDVRLLGSSLEHLEARSGTPIDGIVGFAILKKYIVKINHDNSTLELYDKEGYNFPRNGRAYDVSWWFPVPSIKATLTLDNGEKITGSFLIDTGASTSLILNSPFVNRNRLLKKFNKKLKHSSQGLTSKKITDFKARLKQIKVGDFSFANVPVNLSRAKRGLLASDKIDGILGNGLLKRFNLILDYSNQKLILQPNKNYYKVFKVNSSGIRIKLTLKKKFKIMEIYKGSPAYKLGLKAEDELLAVNGIPTKDLTMNTIIRMFREHGRIVYVTIKRKGKIRNFAMRLKALI